MIPRDARLRAPADHQPQIIDFPLDYRRGYRTRFAALAGPLDEALLASGRRRYLGCTVWHSLALDLLVKACRKHGVYRRSRAGRLRDIAGAGQRQVSERTIRRVFGDLAALDLIARVPGTGRGRGNLTAWQVNWHALEQLLNVPSVAFRHTAGRPDSPAGDTPSCTGPGLVDPGPVLIPAKRGQIDQPCADAASQDRARIKNNQQNPLPVASAAYSRSESADPEPPTSPTITAWVAARSDPGAADHWRFPPKFTRELAILTAEFGVPAVETAIGKCPGALFPAGLRSWLIEDADRRAELAARPRLLILPEVGDMITAADGTIRPARAADVAMLKRQDAERRRAAAATQLSDSAQPARSLTILEAVS